MFGKWRNIAGRYGFEEYDAPVLETEDLYIRKVMESAIRESGSICRYLFCLYYF